MKEIWDIIVIGGGPAGMMSAGFAATSGRKVLLLEKNPVLGKKLSITGGGRCNITNNTKDVRALLTKYKDADKYLFSAFSQYSVEETLDFFHTLGLKTKVEAESRVFPLSEQAEDVTKTMIDFITKNGVVIKTGVEVLGLEKSANKITGIKTNKGTFEAKAYILATGGTSRPDTGSTGDGYNWLAELGHTVARPVPSLVPIAIKEKWVSKVAGLTLTDTNFSIYQNEKLVYKTSGKILFTHEGLSGPGILNNSANIGDTLEHGPVVLKINTNPEKNEEEIIASLLHGCINNPNKKIKNIVAELSINSLASIILEQAGIQEDRICNSITRQERHSLVNSIRGLEVQVSHLLGVDKAIVARGGVKLNEIDFKTMSSKLFRNFYVTGDLLDVLRPSGGYSLQLCWTTGYLAGKSAAALT
jgi:predicted Rossmann fold flavoprotein